MLLQQQSESRVKNSIRKATACKNIDSKISQWIGFYDFVHFHPLPYLNGSILKTGSPAMANFQLAIRSSL
jgi:hypothetical protein